MLASLCTFALAFTAYQPIAPISASSPSATLNIHRCDNAPIEQGAPCNQHVGCAHCTCGKQQRSADVSMSMSIAFAAYMPITPSSATLNIHQCDNEPTVEPSEQQAPAPCGQHLGCAACTCGKQQRGRVGDVSMSLIVDGINIEAAAQAAAAAAATAAQPFAVSGGNGGDAHGRDGIEPVIAAALAACGDCEEVSTVIERAASAAAQRTNANAARVADAIVVATKPLGAGRVDAAQRHPITGQAMYNTMYKFSKHQWEP